VELHSVSEEWRNRVQWLRWPVVVHSLRTGVALASLLVARLFRLPEAYWAPIIDGVLKEAGKRSIEELELERARVLLGLLTTRPEGEKVAQASTADGRTPARTK
jgi:hypothetical protein